MNKKIVVLTGSFNPVTKAHFCILRDALDALGADKGMFIATNDAYLKRKTRAKPKTRTSFCLSEEARRAMLSSLSKEDPRLSFWGFELGGASPSTEKTLRKVAKENPGDAIVYLCGADKLPSIPHWHDIDALFEYVSLAVYDRGETDVRALLESDPFYIRHHDRVAILPSNGAMLDVSSTELRRRFFAGEDYRDLMNLSAYEIMKAYQPSDFPPLTAEMIAEALVRYDGRFGKNGARSLIFKENCRLFKHWDESLFGDKAKLFWHTFVYREEFRIDGEACYETSLECHNEDCADAAFGLIGEGMNPAILNMASSVSPCGGYPQGADAQEEALCRMSNLSYSLYRFGDPKKKYVKEMGYPSVEPGVYPLDINYGGIYTEDVTFFRHEIKEYFRFRDAPFRCGVLTVPSLNHIEGVASPYCDGQGHLTEEGKAVEKNKIRTILRIGLAHHHDSLVLGAFGCGAYRLFPEEVAALFAEAFEEAEFKGKYKKIVFAIKESKGRGKVIGKDGRYKPFYDRFGG